MRVDPLQVRRNFFITSMKIQFKFQPRLVGLCVRVDLNSVLHRTRPSQRNTATVITSRACSTAYLLYDHTLASDNCIKKQVRSHTRVAAAQWLVDVVHVCVCVCVCRACMCTCMYVVCKCAQSSHHLPVTCQSLQRRRGPQRAIYAKCCHAEHITDIIVL